MVKIRRKLRPFIQPGTRLSQRVAFASAWMVVLRLIGRGLGTARIIVLARLLTPEAFGLVGVALLVMELVRTFSDTGFQAALVQRKGDPKTFLDTAWVVQILRGLILGGILAGTAPLVAGLFNAPAARPFVQVMGIVLVLNGFINIGIVYLHKELEVHKRFVYEIIRVLVDLVVSVTAALILMNAWALVFGALGASIAGLITSYLIHPYRPRLKFELQSAKELFNFGRWTLLTRLAGFATRRGDSFVVGAMLGVIALGLYQIAHRISDILIQDIKAVNIGVAFPTYAKIQDDTAKLRRALSVNLGTIASITFPCAITVFLLAPDFVPIVLGEQWIGAVSAIRLLGIGTALYSIISIGGPLFWGIGRPWLSFIIQVTAGVVMFGLIFPFTQMFGVTGAALAFVVGITSALPILIISFVRLLKFDIGIFLRSLVPALCITVLTGTAIIIGKQVTGQVNLVDLISILGVIGVTYITSVLILWRVFKSGPLWEIVSAIQR